MTRPGVATELKLPEEPVSLRDETRALLEDSPREGARRVFDAAFIADFLWREWAQELEAGGMDYEGFLAVCRGYGGETRLWVVGERPWGHYASGLAGRARRRSWYPWDSCESQESRGSLGRSSEEPSRQDEQETDENLACSGVGR